MLKKTKTARGFDLIQFSDRNGEKCSLQKSSLATEDALWLGVDDASPKILCSAANKVGLTPESDSGWMPYPVPEDVLMTTRMHLTKEQVKLLIPVLQSFVETGNI